MRLRSMQAVRCAFVAAAAAACWPAAVQAQGSAPETLYVRSLAATCANCHGTNGRAVPGSTVPTVAGMQPPLV